MPATLTRASEAYTPTYHRRGIDEKVEDPLYVSPFAHTTISNLSTTYTDETLPLTYSEVETKIQALPTTYPGRANYREIGKSFDNQPLHAVQIDDDGIRPIFLIIAAMHGDEYFSQRAIFDFIDHWMTTDHPVLNVARDKLSLFIFPAFNPDGQTATPNPTRVTSENININRNAEPYWDITVHPEKGAAPNSATELGHYINWIREGNTLDRIICGVDCHSWGFSQNKWGFNTHQRYRSIEALRNLEAQYQHLLALLVSRGLPNSSLTILNPTATHYDPNTGEYPRNGRAKMKPYPKDLTAKMTDPRANLIVFENPDNFPGFVGPPAVPAYPNYDATKDDGESYAAAMTVYMDVFLAFTIAACEILEPKITGTLVTPAYDPPLNRNSHITDFNESQQEPSYWNYQGVTGEHFANGENGDKRSFVRITRPDDSAWRAERGRSAYTFVWDGDPTTPTNGLYVAGGEDDGGYLTSTHFLSLDLGATVPPSIAALPKATSYAAMCNDGTTFYYVGGLENDGTTYSATIYTMPVAGPYTWTLWHTMTAGGLHGMTAHLWTDSASTQWLVICGGRRPTPTDQIDEVRLIKISDKSETVRANLATARNQHTSAIYNNTLFVFGGWNGTSTEASVEKVTLETGAVTAGTSLIFSRRRQAIAIDGARAYLCFGKSATLQTEVYYYDMDTDLTGNYSYDLCQSGEAGDDDPVGSEIEEPELEYSVAFVYPAGTALAGTLLIALGRDDTNFRDQIYELEIDDRIMCNRATVNARRGRFRTSLKFDSDDGITTNDSFCWVATLRTAFPYHTAREPYIRPRSITTQAGGALKDWVRSIRTGYIVPPEPGQEYHTFTVPFLLQPADINNDETQGNAEAECRCTVDIYGNSTSADIAAAQLIKTSTSPGVHKPPTRAPIPETGKAVDIFTEVFPESVDSTIAGTQTAWGVFSPCFGAQMVYDVDCLDFTVSGALTELKLQYFGEQDFTNGTQFINSEGKATRTYWYPPTGKFRLAWIENSVPSYIDFFIKVHLNYNRFSRSDRRDIFHWKLESTGINNLTFYGWYYGKTFSKTFTTGSVVTGHVAEGTGITYSEMEMPVSLYSGFSKIDGSNVQNFETLPDTGSTGPIFGMDRRRNSWHGETTEFEEGITVYSQSEGHKRIWRFVWSGISKTFADVLQSFAKLRVFLYYPDTRIANEYRVKARLLRLPTTQRGDGQNYTVFEIEEW